MIFSKGGRIRLVQGIALVAVFGLAACQDSTAPTEKEMAAPESPEEARNYVGPFAAFAAELDDATVMFLPSMTNDEARAKLSVSLDALAQSLVDSKYAATRAEIMTSRALLAAVDEEQAFELLPISMAVDLVESKLDEAGK